MLNEILRTLRVYLQQPSERVGGVNGGVSGGVKDVLVYILKHKGRNAAEIAKALSTSLRTTQRRLAELKKMGKIEYRGAPKNGGYWPTGR